MMFRQAPLHVAKSEHVIWGPFPAPWPILGFALALAIIGPMMCLVGLEHQHLVCDATSACRINDGRAFSRPRIKRVDVVIETGSKNAKYGVIVFTFDNAVQQRFMRVDPDEANEVAAEIRKDLASGAPIDVELHGSRFMIVVGIAALFGILVSLYFGFSRMGHFDLMVSRDRQTLHVRRSLFGIPLGTRDVPLARVDGVIVGKTQISTPLRGRYEPLTPAARLVLRYRSGKTEPLTEKHFAGHALHLRAAWALRGALGVDDDAQDDAELAKIPMRTTPMGSRVAFAWAGLTTGSLVGLALFGLTMIALHQTTPRANIETWMLLAGVIPGAIGGVAVVFHATRTRLPR